MVKITLCYFLMIVAAVMAASLGENEDTSALRINKRHAAAPDTAPKAGAPKVAVPAPKAAVPAPKAAVPAPKADAPAPKAAALPPKNTASAPKDAPTSKNSTPPVGCNEGVFEKSQKCCKVPTLFSAATIKKCPTLEPGKSEAGKPAATGGKPSGTPTTKGKRDLRGLDGSEGPKNMTCMIAVEGLLATSGEIDPDILKTKFNAAAAAAKPIDPAWPATFSAALTDCQAKATAAPATATADANQKNQMLITCLKKTLLVTCPTASIDATVTTCSATLKALSCDPFILPPPTPPAAGAGAGAGPGAKATEVKPKPVGKTVSNIAG